MDFSKEEPNLLSDSDDSDEDYVPPGAEGNLPSEVESEGDDEDPSESDEEDPNSKKRKKGQKASKKKARKKGRKSTQKEDVNTEEKDDDTDNNESNDKKVLSEEEEKKRADSLWADFMSDTKSSKPQPKKITSVNSKHEETEDKKGKEPKKEEKENKVIITEVFEFAGEEVKVTKEVDVASKEARIVQAAPKTVGSSSSGSPAGRGRGRGAGGLTSILGQIGKKAKIGTLEKSKLDWDRFKRTEGIEDELRTFNRGKDGYLEKQDFLQRADLRQFEIEKSLRATRRSNR
ncbi:Craniofacial development protein 1 [Gryllus bimaculatus]|nr:Craniofacial development protein 1 [Gryllus bimaculatus]